MNHIFKTVMNKSTGLISVVSEKTSNNCKSHKTGFLAEKHGESSNVINHVRAHKKNLLAVMVGLALMTCLSSMSYAQNYTGTESLVSTLDIDPSIKNLLGGGVKKGIFVIDNSVTPSTENIELNINYDTGSIPDFLIAGYTNVPSFNDSRVFSSGSNSINLKKGGINGSVYSGLTYLDNKSDFECHLMDCGKIVIDNQDYKLSSSGNSIEIFNGFNGVVSGGVYSGVTKNLEKFTNIKTKDSNGINANANFDIEFTNIDRSIDSNENKVSIDGLNSYNDVVVGLSLKEYLFGDIKNGNTNAENTLEKEEARAKSSTSIKVDNNGLNINSNKNSMMVKGENSFLNIDVGLVENINKIYDLETGTAVATIESKNNQDSGFSFYANAYSSAFIGLQQRYGNFNANDNSVIINGKNIFSDINAGVVAHEISIRDIRVKDATVTSHLLGGVSSTSGDANARANSEVITLLGLYWNNFSANGNNVGISGENTFKNIQVGTANSIIDLDSLKAGDSFVDLKSIDKTMIRGSYSSSFASATTDIWASMSTFNANNNSVEVSGLNHFEDVLIGSAKNTIIAKNISSGLSELYSSGDLFSDAMTGSVFTVKISVDRNNLSADGNRFLVNGENHFNNILLGSSGVDFDVSNLKASKTFLNDIGGSGSGSVMMLTDLSETKITSSNNSIVLNGKSDISGNIYTGYVDFNIKFDKIEDGDGIYNIPKVYINGDHPGKEDYGINLNDTSVSAVNNSITINGDHAFNNPNSVIYGGYLSYNKDMNYKPETYDVFTGNTLNYSNRTPITIKEIGNFQTYNFTLDPEQNKNIAMITADKISLGTNSDNFSDASQQLSSDVFVTGIRSGKALSTGTEFLLMQGNIEGSGSGHDTDGLEQKNVQQGISLLYDVKTKVDANTGKVTATIISGHDEPENPDPKVNPQLKSLLEGNLANLMLLTRSADNLAYNTFSVITEQNRQKGLVPFVQSSGHHARYNSGSHIDANGGLMTAGISFQNDKLTLAVFSENGWDSYDSHNTFAEVAKVDASGNNRFNGGGIFGQYNFNNGLYADASFRAGRLHSNYKTDDIRNAVTGETASYKTDSKYLGAHAGLGYQFQINPLNSYDLNLKYLWANTEAQDLTVAGDEIHFDKLNSHRLRLNGENSYQFNPSWSLLLGTGLEYEFEGEAEGTTYKRFRMDAPSVKGFTALGSLGVRFQPVSNKNLTIDFKGQGYLGERDGGGALLHMQYAF